MKQFLNFTLPPYRGVSPRRRISLALLPPTPGDSTRAATRWCERIRGRFLCRERPRRGRRAEQRDELAPFHVWMAPAWQEVIWRAAQRSLAVMCPACWCSPGGLLALMGCANRVLIIQTGSMSR